MRTSQVAISLPRISVLAGGAVRETRRLFAECASSSTMQGGCRALKARSRCGLASCLPRRVLYVEEPRFGSVDVVVVSDGEHHRYSLSRGETRTFMAEMALKLEVMDGGAVHLTVNGVDMGVPGFDGVPWRHSYSFDTTSNSASSGG